MHAPQNVRASDRSDFTAAKRSDFTRRRREITARQIYTICLMLLLVIVGVGLLVYNDALVGSGLCVVVGAVLWFFARHLERGEHKLQATQFLNAMFASLLTDGYKFSMIVSREGEIVYLDRGFQAWFPDLMARPRRTLEMLFDEYGVPVAQRQGLADMLAAAAESSAALSIATGKERAVQSLTLEAKPVPRPAGYVLLRAR